MRVGICPCGTLFATWAFAQVAHFGKGGDGYICYWALFAKEPNNKWLFCKK